ncbi:MAG TPA: ABC transporter permease [Haliangiales bacterium]|nr:ABC transporter permease [Haliangiales bacterium]
MTVLRALIRKDINVYLHDRRAVILSFALPAALTLFFGLAFSGSKRAAEAPKIPTLVVDDDRTPGSQRLAAALAADPTLAAKPAARDEARDAVKDGRFGVAVVIPAGFAATTAAALGGAAARAQLEFIYDPSSPFSLQIAEGVVHGLVVRALAPDVSKERLEACASLAEPYRAERRPAAGGETYDGAAHAVGGMAVQFILMGAIENAVAILTDRQRGLWRRLRAAPLSRATLLASKIISGALLALLVLGFLLVFGRVTLGVRVQGSGLGLLLVGVSFALLASSVGVLVSTLGKTPQATRSVGIFVVLIAVMLGGAWFPSFLFPAWLQPITRLFPSRWAVDGFDAMTWRGLDVSAAIFPAAGMLGAAAIFAALAAWRFKWEE